MRHAGPNLVLDIGEKRKVCVVSDPELVKSPHPEISGRCMRVEYRGRKERDMPPIPAVNDLPSSPSLRSAHRMPRFVSASPACLDGAATIRL